MLLPPSEGKTPAPRTGPRLALDALAHPGLTPVRRTVLEALVEVSARPDALAVLGVGAGVGDQVARNTALPTAPTAPARRVYSGLLFEAAGLDRLTPAQRLRAERSVLVVSALWGVVTPTDPIPAYRLSMGTDLPGVGPLAATWRDALAAELDERVTDDLVVDCRSATYAAAWRAPRTARAVNVRVLRELDGVRAVVSHNAKHTRGVLTRHLLTRRGRDPRDPDELARVARELVGTELVGTGVPGTTLCAVELEGARGHGPHTLSLVVA